MGIQVWYAREVLPGAKPVCREVEQERSVEQPVPVVSAVEAGSISEKELIQHEESALPEETVRSTVPQFSLVAVHCSPQVLLVSDIEFAEGEHLSDVQWRLIVELASAVGVTADRRHVSYFKSPDLLANKVTNGELIARDAVNAFCHTQIAERKVRFILVMGTHALRYLRPSETKQCAGSWSIVKCQAVATCGVDEMLEQPQLKQQVWYDVQLLLQLLEETRFRE